MQFLSSDVGLSLPRRRFSNVSPGEPTLGRIAPLALVRWRPMSLRIAAVCGALVVLALSACGGSSKSSGSLSKSDFVSRADAICGKVNAARSNIGAPSSAAQLISSINKLQAAVQPDVTQLQSLSARAPADIKGDYDQFVAKLSTMVALLPGLGQAAKANDVSKAQRLEAQFQTTLGQARAAAKRAQLGSACTT
jgi:hypothetical protein